jgi:predicted amidohydrolase YtcJ
MRSFSFVRASRVLGSSMGDALQASALKPRRSHSATSKGRKRDNRTMPAAATTVFRARRVITMEPNSREATAVAVSGQTIVAAGSFEDLRNLGDAVVDETFADSVVCPGFIDQHLHPILGATTLATEVIAPEEWALPGRVFPAVQSEREYRRALRNAEQALGDPRTWLFSWGYHPLWHGQLNRALLDEISGARPIAVWHRSCHEWFLNSAAIKAWGITHEQLAGHGRASTMVDLERGHWWETGLNLLMPKLASTFMTPDRITRGLRQLVSYLHSNGVTAFNEPGIMWDVEPWQLYQEILGAEDTPFLSTFLVDARGQADAGMDPADAVADAEAQVARACTGKVRLLPKHVKLFADGAIISQLMQMNEPYLDDAGLPDPCHHGEWMMEPDTFRAFARVYWDAGWQLHIHVNGDAGLDMVLDTIEYCAAHHPREDHRTVIIHFANSTEQQIDTIARVGAIVSANSYYPVGFADKFSRHGLGPTRADSMVRSASVLRRGIPLSFHSDLPMGPADPLTLAWCAVNRRTQSGRIAGPEQRISVHDALRAITIEAAYSWRMENELGSIAPGKAANFTVLGEDPYAVDPEQLQRIPVLATVYAGRLFPAAV